MQKASISADFSSQLESLMHKVKQAEPHFTRCIKPNAQAVADLFNSAVRAYKGKK